VGACSEENLGGAEIEVVAEWLQPTHHARYRVRAL
jgi:hypothetical protein